ncbi:cysteine desulfurase family protein [Collinsella vaginalis]|uniref:cysteine desulfurase family protein n=1 Tax=Collinsella vaginalis TaxID=1870987 RepID=UPI000A26C571|nr:cysteine desulfurase family protein [Collinsella vaginalis]
MRPAAPINLDYAASTPLRPEAIAAERAFDASPIAGANPNSLHSLGRQAQARLEQARRALAASFGPRVRASEVVFTGGGTEAVALGLIGLATGVRMRDRERSRVIVSAIEHDAVLDNIGALRGLGFTVDTVRPRREGAVHAEDLEALMGPDVALVATMFANNETGVIQPVSKLARVAHAAGALIFADAVQGWLHAPFDVAELDVDALSVAGHKVGGPVGTGALYVRHLTPIRPLIQGGGQERGLRPGTQDLRAIVALEAVVSSLAPRVAADAVRVRALSDALYARLTAHPAIHATVGDPAAVDRLPGIVSVYVEGFESEELILKLDVAGFEVSAASACSSGSLDASHVLTAMGIPTELALGSLRISFDDRVSAADLDRFADVLLEIVS